MQGLRACLLPAAGWLLQQCVSQGGRLQCSCHMLVGRKGAHWADMRKGDEATTREAWFENAKWLGVAGYACLRLEVALYTASADLAVSCYMILYNPEALKSIGAKTTMYTPTE